MNKSKELREVTRILERNLDCINSSDCCLCSVNTTQCHTLVEIGRKRDSMLKDLAATLRIDVSTASKIVEELVKKELVIREPSKSDRRSVQINLSDKGIQIFEQIENDMNLIFNEIFKNIDPAEHESILKSISLYNRAIEQWKVEKQHE
ncbi:MAG: MarR family winged helix-turn-helix transcriptional regulator [Lachnotalea sp.]